MFEKLIALFERFVVAHEKIAEAHVLLVNAPCITTPGPITFTPEPGPITFTPEPVKQEAQTPPTADPAGPAGGTPASGWNPFLSDLQGRYGADKISILDGLLAEKGIEMKAKATGAEKHQALLDWANTKKDELADALAEPAAATEPEPVAEAAPAVTIDDLRALAQRCMAAKIAPARVQDLLEQHGGSRRLPEVAEAKYAAVLAALKQELGE